MEEEKKDVTKKREEEIEEGVGKSKWKKDELVCDK